MFALQANEKHEGNNPPDRTTPERTFGDDRKNAPHSRSWGRPRRFFRLGCSWCAYRSKTFTQNFHYRLDRWSATDAAGFVHIDSARVRVCFGGLAFAAAHIPPVHQDRWRAELSQMHRRLRRAAIPFLPFLGESDCFERRANRSPRAIHVRAVRIKNELDVGNAFHCFVSGSPPRAARSGHSSRECLSRQASTNCASADLIRFKSRIFESMRSKVLVARFSTASHDLPV